MICYTLLHYNVIAATKSGAKGHSRAPSTLSRGQGETARNRDPVATPPGGARGDVEMQDHPG